MSLLVLFSSWSMGGGGLIGFQSSQAYLSPYLAVKNYQPDRNLLLEAKTGMLWFSGEGAGGPFRPPWSHGEGTEMEGLGAFFQASVGYRLMDPAKKEECCLATGGCITRYALEPELGCC